MIVFFTNYINHHQVCWLDELYNLTNGDFICVLSTEVSAERRVLGYKEIDRPYLLQTLKSKENTQKAFLLACEADIAIFGASSLPYQVERMKLGKLSFEVGERWLKRGLLNLLSPRLLKNMWYYHTLFHNKQIYKLCSSAYATNDQYLMQSYKNRCYKWAYFTNVEECDIDAIIAKKSNRKIKILWCARYLWWKHPEMAIYLAKRLKDAGYEFELNMFGVGELYDKMSELCNKLGVDDVVCMKGSVPNEQMVEEMRGHNIFLFTSDKHEGWGAVLNEAMSSGCAVVASNEIGSVPFLVKDGKNGLIFKSKNLDSLYEKVVLLLNNNELIGEFGKKAYYTMLNEWSPKVAAKNILQLINDLQNGKDTSIIEGPCSKALPIK